MGKSHGNSAQLGEAERTVVQERTTDFLRSLYPTKTADNVAVDTGISANTISKWLERGSAPASWAFLRLLEAYGPELACAVMADPPAWLDRAAREQKRERLEAQIASLQSQLDGGRA
ncbi:transcriptional regulator [Methylobacterium sp. Leaf108]|uniref:transcriptional regulator n=1 Tax=Methylobacterium sp. Leaf108 TaxID=1736256 RepID=UPI0006F94938|nr:transcriptional regulator [Methylobacterium sp. Leaf108]KQP61084.1 hypothetical protein ASF39_15545 [Methylobacterium sp. Leaf108]